MHASGCQLDADTEGHCRSIASLHMQVHLLAKAMIIEITGLVVQVHLLPPDLYQQEMMTSAVTITTCIIWIVC